MWCDQTDADTAESDENDDTDDEDNIELANMIDMVYEDSGDNDWIGMLVKLGRHCHNTLREPFCFCYIYFLWFNHSNI